MKTKLRIETAAETMASEPEELSVGGSGVAGWLVMDDWLLVRLIENSGERRSVGGIALPDSIAEAAPENSVRYEVLAAGPGRKNEKGEREPLRAKEHDVVIAPQLAAEPVIVMGQHLALLSDDRVRMIERRR